MELASRNREPRGVCRRVRANWALLGHGIAGRLPGTVCLRVVCVATRAESEGSHGLPRAPRPALRRALFSTARPVSIATSLALRRSGGHSRVRSLNNPDAESRRL